MSRHSSRLARVARSFLVAVVFGASASAQYARPEPWDAAVREIRSASRFSADGSHHLLLVALRQLRDPSLRPFFQSLVQGEHWSIQVDGMLGLAELSSTQRVDPFLLSQLKGEEDRATAIAAALRLGMIGAEEATTMLTWEDLSPRDQVLLHAEILRRGGPIDAARLGRLAAHRNDHVAALASFILAGSGSGGDAALAAFRQRFAALPERERNALLASVVPIVSDFNLAASAPFLAEVVADATLPADIRNATIAALLRVAPQRGYEAWRAAVAGDSSQANRVRLALVLLAVETILPKEPAAPLRRNAEPLDPLLGRLADALDAIASGGDAAPVLRDLVSTRHRPSMSAVMDAATRLDARTRTSVLLAYADLLALPARRELSPAAIELCLAALAELATLDPSAVGARLALLADGSERDEELQNFLMLALAAANTPEAAAVAAANRERLGRRAASIALVLMARHNVGIDPNTIRELGVIASGGGRVDRPYQIQAAWLFAKYSGKGDQAIAAALTP